MNTTYKVRPPAPTDTEMLDWIIPVIHGQEGNSDARFTALFNQLRLNVRGRDAIRAAMESLGDV